MSCESYVRKRAVFHVRFDRNEHHDEDPLIFKDDYELLAYLLHQEQIAENSEIVSFESVTSD